MTRIKTCLPTSQSSLAWQAYSFISNVWRKQEMNVSPEWHHIAHFRSIREIHKERSGKERYAPSSFQVFRNVHSSIFHSKQQEKTIDLSHLKLDHSEVVNGLFCVIARADVHVSKHVSCTEHIKSLIYSELIIIPSKRQTSSRAFLTNMVVCKLAR